LKFGVGSPQWNWSDFKRLETVVGLQEPIGTIKMWYGTAANVPAGWHVCDGTNGTPDMRGRFPVGAAYDATQTSAEYAVGKTGGEAKHTLTVEEMPSHAHKIYLSSTETDNGGEWWARKPVSSATSEYATSEKSGGSKSHENRPPYLALYYIMKISNI
jgi:microcystin-dependent protein